MLTRNASVVVVIPTLNGERLLRSCLESIGRDADAATRVVVVDNASTDGTVEMLAEAFPDVEVIRNQLNLGFGRAVNRGIAAAGPDAEAIVLLNNDTAVEPGFFEALLAPLADARVGMVAGVLLQGARPERIDSAGIELDETLRSFDMLWDRPVEELAFASDPVGPCGGAAAFRAAALAQVGGFDEAFFAYWEDVDLALRLRLGGWECRLARDARALHHHGQTLGAASPAARALEAFGRGYVLARYGVPKTGGTRARLAVAALDWPALLVHLVVRRELRPLRARLRGRARARAGPRFPAPRELATVPLRESLSRQWRFLGQRLRGRAPRHFYERSGTASTR